MFAEAAMRAHAEGGMHHLMTTDIELLWLRADFWVSRGGRVI